MLGETARYTLFIFSLLQEAPSSLGLSVAWIGNSYTYYNDLPTIVFKLAAADNQNLHFGSHTVGGWSLEDHSKSQMTEDLLTSYPWDVVVLQEQSARCAFPESYVCSHTKPYLDVLEGIIRSNNPKTRLQFYLSWGRPHGLDSQCPNYPDFCQFETMQDALTKTYSTFGCMKRPASVAPVGEAFRLVKDSLGEEEFYNLYNTGGVSDHHPSKAGSYLSGLLHYKALFPEQDLLGNTETLGLDFDYAELLQGIAESTWANQGEYLWEYQAEDVCNLSMCDNFK